MVDSFRRLRLPVRYAFRSKLHASASRVLIKRQVLLILLVVAVSARLASAQWLSQYVELKPGWNGVFIHVSFSHRVINTLVGQDPGNPVQQIWR